VLRPAGEGQHFQVVLAAAVSKYQAIACVYSSKTGLWGNLISTPILYDANEIHRTTVLYTDDAVMAGDSIYWKLAGNLFGMLEFDLVKQSLSVIRLSVEMRRECKRFTMIRADSGGLGCLVQSDSDYTAQLWNRKTDCDGVASWGIARTIELDKALGLKSKDNGTLSVLGYAEENNVLFLWTVNGVFMINLETLKFKKFLEYGNQFGYHPFESVYTAGNITCFTLLI
jgi:hypothetical protein